MQEVKFDTRKKTPVCTTFYFIRNMNFVFKILPKIKRKLTRHVITPIYANIEHVPNTLLSPQITFLHNQLIATKHMRW